MAQKKRNYLGDKIYEWRTQHGYSQAGFAKFVGVSRQTVMSWEAGSSMPQAEKLQQISDIIGIGLDQIMSNIEAQLLEEVGADEVVQEGEVAEIKKGRKLKLSPKAKIAIATTVIVLALLIGILLIVFDRIFTMSNYEGIMSLTERGNWNFGTENVGWIIFGVSIAVGVTLGVVSICKLVKNKKKVNENTNGVKP